MVDSKTMGKFLRNYLKKNNLYDTSEWRYFYFEIPAEFYKDNYVTYGLKAVDVYHETDDVFYNFYLPLDQVDSLTNVNQLEVMELEMLVNRAFRFQLRVNTLGEQYLKEI